MRPLEIQRSPLTVCVEQLQQSAGPAASNESTVALAAKLLTDDSTLQACGHIIRRDLGLTLRVLRTANSAMFNHIGPTVMNVTHAAALLGTDALSQIVDTVPRNTLPRPARELVVLSYLTAVIARTLIGRIEPRCTEEAFLSGLFRNIGEVCYVLENDDEYQRMLAASQGQMAGLRAACRSRAKFDFDELSAGLLQQWSFHGPPVMAAQSTPEALLAQLGNPEAEIALAGCTAHYLTIACYRCDIHEREKVMRHCLTALTKRYHLPESQVHVLSVAALDAVYPMMERLGVKKDQLCLKEWVPAQPPVVKKASPPVEIPRGATIPTLLDTAVARGIDRAAWLNYADPDITVATIAGGTWPANVMQILPQLIQPRKPPFLLAFGHRQDVWIDFQRDDRFTETPLAHALKPAAIFLLPVHDGRKVRGCLYFDWTNRRDFSPETLLPTLAALRDYLATNTPAG